MRAGEVLLDTHALAWWAEDNRALSRQVRRFIENEQTRILVSAATVWEIATKVRLGKLRWAGPDSVEAYCIGAAFRAPAGYRRPW